MCSCFIISPILLGIENFVANNEIEDTLEARLTAAAKNLVKARGNPLFGRVSYFTEEEFDVFAEGVKEAGAMGFMYTEGQLREVLQNGVRADYEKLAKYSGIKWVDAISPKGDIPAFGKNFMSRLVHQKFQ